MSFPVTVSRRRRVPVISLSLTFLTTVAVLSNVETTYTWNCTLSILRMILWWSNYNLICGGERQSITTITCKEFKLYIILSYPFEKNLSFTTSLPSMDVNSWVDYHSGCNSPVTKCPILKLWWVGLDTTLVAQGLAEITAESFCGTSNPSELVEPSPSSSRYAPRHTKSVYGICEWLVEIPIT